MIDEVFRNEYQRTRELVQKPDWYLEFGKERRARLLGLGAVQAARSGDITKAAHFAKRQTVEIFEQLLEEDAVRLGIPGVDELDDQDELREPISQLVIHHSNRAEGISLSNLSALQLLNVYLPVYQNKNKPVLNSHGEHQPIYSGHYNKLGKQVFYQYHWFVKQDGEAIRLLDDDALAWHAGDWEVNKRSVAICIDDDLNHKSPTQDSFESVVDIIQKHYSYIPVEPKAIIGHKEANEKTECPGDRFIGGWKNDLLKRIAR